MLRPDSVNLVTPPKTTAPKHIPAMPPIQYPTILGVACVALASAFNATVVVHLLDAFLRTFVKFDFCECPVIQCLEMEQKLTFPAWQLNRVRAQNAMFLLKLVKVD